MAGEKSARALSATSSLVLRIVDNYSRENGFPPSVRDIQTIGSLSSTSVVDYNLRLLERRGYITRNREQARSVLVKTAPKKRGSNQLYCYRCEAPKTTFDLEDDDHAYFCPDCHGRLNPEPIT